jgi:hypothetical protein
LADLRDATARYCQPRDLLRYGPRHDVSSRHYTFQGPVAALSVTYPEPSGLRAWWRYGTAAVIALVGSLLGYVPHMGKRAIALRRWSFAGGVLAGLTWWLFATPSSLGWVIVAISLWGALRWPLPSHVVRSAASDAVVPASR